MFELDHSNLPIHGLCNKGMSEQFPEYMDCKNIFYIQIYLKLSYDVFQGVNG